MMYSPKEEQEIKSNKFSFLAIIFFTGIIFSLLFMRLLYLQVSQGEKLHHQSQINRFKTRLLKAPRGLVLDRNSNILIGNKSIANLKINLNDIKNKKELIKKISPIINLSPQSIEKIIKQQTKRYGSYHPITIKKSLNIEEVYKLKLLHWDFHEAYVEEASIRTYPLMDNGSQIFGYTDNVSKAELKNLKDKNLHAMDSIGKQGIEREYNSYLKGTNGWAYIEVDALNRISPESKVTPLSVRPPIKGSDVVLTIDKDLQDFVYKVLKKRTLNTKKGSVIVMKTNGEILAWVNIPSFDANIFSYKINKKDWEALSTNNSKLFINKGFQEHYSPGSTLKPFIAIAALSENIISKNSKINSPSRIKFGNRYFHDHSILGHGLIDVTTAIEKSANTFFYQIGNQLGIDRVSKYLNLFGFGKNTQIELSGEVSGVAPNKHWKKKKFQARWRDGDTINTSIGQGFMLVTLLQLAVAYNTIATEGLLVKPFLVKKVSDKIIEPKVLDTLTDRISRDHFMTVKKGLQKVVEGSKGTARFWKSFTTTYGGKTGTAQVVSMSSKQLYTRCKSLPIQLRHHGIFVGLAPIENTEIVVSVLAENSCSGGAGAAPIARDIIDYYMKNLKEQ